MSTRKQLTKISNEVTGNDIPQTVEELFEVLVNYLDKQNSNKSNTSSNSTNGVMM